MHENPYRPPQTLSTADESLLRDAHDSTGHKPRIWTVFAAPVSAITGILLLSVVFASVAVAWMVSRRRSLEELDVTIDGFMESPLGYALIMLVNQMPVLAVAWTAGWLSPVPIARRLGLLPSGLSPLQFTVVVLGVGMPFLMGVGLTQALSDFTQADETFLRALDRVTWPTLAPFVAAIALLPGVAEELLFHGYMQRRLLERWPPWIAVVATTLCYALGHFELYGALISFPPALWLGWVAWKANSIWPSIVSHVAATACWTLVPILMRLTGAQNLPTWLTPLACLAALPMSIWAARILTAQGRSEPAYLI